MNTTLGFQDVIKKSFQSLEFGSTLSVSGGTKLSTLQTIVTYNLVSNQNIECNLSQIKQGLIIRSK